MSENEIKPVALWDLTCETTVDGREIPGTSDVTPAPNGRFVHIDDYQSAIDRLTAERDAAVAERDADKIELARHRRDAELYVLITHDEANQWEQAEKDRDEAQRKLSVAVAEGKGLVAERNAAVADANRFRFISRLKCNHFHIGYNDGHKVNYTSLKEWIDESDDLYSDVDSETRRMMVESDSDWSIQIYPDTPIGFNVYRASTLADVIDAAMKEQEQGK